MLRTLLTLALLAAPGLALADDDKAEQAEKAAQAERAARAARQEALKERAAALEKYKAAIAEKEKAAELAQKEKAEALDKLKIAIAEKEKAARDEKEHAAAALAKYKAAVAEKERVAREEKELAVATAQKLRAATLTKERAAREEDEKATAKPRVARLEKVAADDDKLAALEQKLQALLKEIQSLKGAKAPPAKVEAPRVIGRIADPKAAQPHIELQFKIENDKIVGAKPDAKAEPKRVAVEVKDGKPHAVVIGADGKAQKIELDKAHGFKLEGGALELKLDNLDLKKLTDLHMLKGVGAVKIAEGEKAKDAKDGAKAKDERKVEVVVKPTAGDGQRIIVIDGNTGRIISETDLTGAKAGAGAKSAALRTVIDKETGKVLRVEAQPPATPAPAAPPVKAPETVRAQMLPARTGAAATYSYSTRSDGDGVITLTRASYALSGDRAKALADFLQAFAKAKVLETKVEGDKIIVTTTPDVQSTIGQVVGLMTGKPAGATFRFSSSSNTGNLYQFAPASPRPPSLPKVPEPVKAAEPKKEKKKEEPKKEKKQEKKDDDDGI